MFVRKSGTNLLCYGMEIGIEARRIDEKLEGEINRYRGR
jgi:hypothetical protein